MFSSERIVVIEEPGKGVVTSLFVDRTLVEIDGELRNDAPVPGRLRVEVGPVADRMNVFLPVSSVEHGRVVSLPATLLAG